MAKPLSPLLQERQRIQALWAGDPSANFAGYEAPEATALPITAGTDSRTGKASSSVITPTGFKTQTGTGPSLAYQDEIRKRLSNIGSISDNPTINAMRAAQARMAANQAATLNGVPGPTGAMDYSAAGVTSNERRQNVLEAAARQRGMPYAWGGGNYNGATQGGSSTRSTTGGPVGFDCSGLVQYAFAQVGIRLPRFNQDQLAQGIRMPINKLQPGDLVGSAGHVAIYAGNGMMWESPTFGKTVRLAPVRAGMFGVHIRY